MLERQQVQELREKLQKVLDEAADELGFKAAIGNGRYSDTVHFKITFAPVDAFGEPTVNQQEGDFKRYAHLFRLKPEWVGMEYIDDGERMKIVGLVLRRRKYPVIVQRIRDGKKFKSPASRVILFMEKETIKHG